MDLLEIPLPNMYEQILGKDEDTWPPEARFLVAAHYGNVRRLKEIARKLDRKGKAGEEATVAATTYRGMNALHAAVGGQGKLAACRYLVETVKMDVNMWDASPSKKTPLEHAVDGGNLPALRYLLDHGADLTREGDGGLTVLHHAARKGRCEIVKLLLSRGADVDGNSEHGTPLHLAAIKGHESTVEVLLEHHADVDKVVPSCLVTPLKAALLSASTPCVKLLVQAGANVNDVNNSLARAASEGLTECVKCLLEAGADPNRPDECGRMPIELAAVYGTREDVELLFPVTSPISTVADWSIDGIINHAKLERLQLQDEDVLNTRKSELKRKRDEAFEKQDYTNASEFYTQALKVDPSDGKMLASRSRCWLQLGDGQKALEDATRCKRRCPEWAEARLRRGQALMLLKDYEKACEELTGGVELDPENDEMDKLFWEAMELKEDVINTRKSDLKRKGDEAFEKQDYTNASEFYTQALKVDPSDGKMLASRSRCWLQLGDGQKALEDANRCKRRCPEWAEARLLRGQALMLLKDYEKACEELSSGVELDPENDEMDKLYWEAMELKMK